MTAAIAAAIGGTTRTIALAVESTRLHNRSTPGPKPLGGKSVI